MARTICICLAACLATPAFAQSPRAGGPAPGDEHPDTVAAIEAAITGNIARGFVNRELISARGIIQGWTGPWGLYIQPYWLYGRIGEITTDNEIYVRTGLFRTIAAPIFAYGVTVYDHSLRRQIEHRNLAGGGLGANVLQAKGQVVSLSVGTLYEVTDFGATVEDPRLVDGSVGRDLRQTGRWSVRVYGRYKLAGGKLGLIHDLIVVPSFRDPGNDYRILAFGSIDAPIAKGFAVRVQVDATREGLIVEGTKNNDLVLTFGVVYRNEWAASPPAEP